MGGIFLFSTISTMVLRPIQSLVQWVQGASTQRVRLVELTPHLHEVLKCRLLSVLPVLLYDVMA
jgi:hypothetical protein